MMLRALMTAWSECASELAALAGELRIPAPLRIVALAVSFH
jgi:hypothetical protein